jgi:hypothetical protein
MRFDGASGAHGPLHIAASGSKPLDDFTCYPQTVSGFTGGCRYGGYSIAQAFGGKIYMAAEYTAPSRGTSSPTGLPGSGSRQRSRSAR